MSVLKQSGVNHFHTLTQIIPIDLGPNFKRFMSSDVFSHLTNQFHESLRTSRTKFLSQFIY